MPKVTIVETPECDRLLKVSVRSQEIVEFLEWLQSTRELTIAEWRGHDLYPVSLSVEKLLAEFFGIDLNKVEAERRQILSQLREASEHRTG